MTSLDVPSSSGGVSGASASSLATPSRGRALSASPSPSPWLSAPLSSPSRGVSGSPQPGVAYDRRRLRELVATSNAQPSVALAQSYLQLQSSSGRSASLYSSALLQLAAELAKLTHVPWEKVARMCALCPPLPSAAAQPQLGASWKEMTAAFNAQTDGEYDDDEDEEEEEEEQDLTSKNNNEDSRLSSLPPPVVQWEFSPARLAVVESGGGGGGGEALDSRVDGLWSLARYLILAAAAGETAAASHLGRLLPVLLRFLLSLPFCTYDTLNFPTVAPRPVAHTAVNLLAELAKNVRQSRKLAATAVLILLRQCADAVLGDANKAAQIAKAAATGAPQPQQAQSFASSSAQYLPVLEGVLAALGDHPFPLGENAASSMGDELHKLFLAKYLLPASLYGLVLRATTTLLAAHPDAYSPDRLKYLFEHEFMRVGFTYSQAPLLVGASTPAAAGSVSPGLPRRPSIGGSGGGAGGVASATSVAEAAQALILVQTINLGVLVGLIATSRPGLRGEQPNCTAAEEERIKEQSLHKLKQMLDQILNVQLVEPAPAPAQSAAVANALMSPVVGATKGLPHVGSASSASSTIAIPLVVIGCVDASRAILNGVMELANKYASDGASIPNIVEAIRSILLGSRRLTRHPKEKQLRFYLTISLSKIFKLELLQLQGHASLATSLVRSVSTQDMQAAGSYAGAQSVAGAAAPAGGNRNGGRSRAASNADAEPATGNGGGNDSLSIPTLRMVRSSSSHALNNHSGGIAAAYGHFSNSFTRSFVQSLQAQLYKDDIAAHSTSASASASDAAASAKSLQLYQRILVLLLDLVSLIDFAPLTLLVMPGMIARLTARPYFLHLVIQQLTDVALMEERRYAAKQSAAAAAASAAGKSAPVASVTAGALSPDLKIFDSIINLFMQAYAARPFNESDAVAASGAPNASAAAASSRKTAIELPAALLRIATELRAPQLKRHLLRRILRLTLDLAAEVRSDELAMAQALAELEKAKRQKKKQPEPAAAAAALNIGGVNRTEACGFLLPVLAVLIRDCYAEQAASQAASPQSQSHRAQQVGLQLFSNPDSNVKWFRRLWFFLVSFHFTDALVSAGSGAGGSNGAAGAATQSSGGGSGGSVGVGDTWSESIRSIALYSPLLINTASFADVLSVELAKEYELAFRRVDRAGSTALLAAAGSGSGAGSSSDGLSSAAVEKITAKLHAALADGYRKQLTALFPAALAWDISQLSMGRVLFLLTLVHLETIRIKASCGAAATLTTASASPSAQLPAPVAALQAARRSLGGGALHVLFAYLGHYPLSRMDLTKFVSSFGELSAFPLVGRLVFKEDGGAGAGIGAAAGAPARRAEMESAIQFLLRSLAGRVEIQRRTALHFLHNLTRAHVHLQWSSNCLATLLELLQVVQESLDTNVALQPQSPSSSYSGGGGGARGPSGVNEFAQLKQTLDMPDDLVQRREVHKTLQSLARSWLDSAKAHVPEQTALVVQEFVQRVQRNLSRHTNRESWHTSLHLLLQSSQLGSASASSNGSDPMSSWGLDSLPGIIGGLNIRERYLGEIKGLYRSYHESADRKRRDWAVARAKREAHAAAAAAHAHAHAQPNRAAGGVGGEDHLRPPLHSGTRSMSVLIQDEQAEAFQRLLHRRAHRHDHASPQHAHDSIDSAAGVGGAGKGDSGNGPQIPPFGRLLTAKLIAEGNEILHSFHTIHAAPQSESGPGAGVGAAAQDAQAQRARSEREREENLAQLHRRFERLLCLTAALLIWSTHARRAAVSAGTGPDSNANADADLDVDAQDLLHLVVKAPSQIFTPEAMETSVVVWEWILGSNSAFQLPLMVEMKAAWGYTVDRQVGLFSHRRQAKTKEAKSEEKKLPLAHQAQGSAAQGAQQAPAHGARPTSPVSSNAYSVPSQGGNLDPSASQLNSPRPLPNKGSEPTLLPNASDPAVVVAPGVDGVVRTGVAPNLVHPPAVLASGSGAAAGGNVSVALDATGLPLSSSTGAGAGSAAGGVGSQHDLAGSDLIQVCQPHLIWINFLLSHFKYLRSFSRDIINILAGMLHKSFARVDLLSSGDKSFGCRMRLLHLGLQLVQGGSDGGAPLLDLRDQQLLRDRIYTAALHWFHAQPCWYDPGTPRQLREDVQVVLDFCAALQREDQHWAEPRDVQEVVEDLSYPLAAPGTKAAARTTAASAATAKSRVAELQKQRNLLVFLLSHELDRIHTWHAPLGGGSDALPPSGSFTTHRSMYAPEWRTLIGTAWGLSPKLCVRLCQRFQQNAIVLGEITKLVQAHPALVYDLPEAVVFLVTEEVLKRAAAAAAAQDASGSSASVLRHLIYWAPATLPVAIWFLCAPFCHNRLVLEYAVHTLRSHPPESVMFYLSQIIQCLRNDSDDQLLYQFLLESSKASVLLSHQLLWLAQAELGEVKSTTKYVQTPFRQLIERLIADVIRHFDSVERRFFQQEFEFFEQITAISGILKPIPTKQGRKDKIKEQLQLIHKPTPNIYLPTNPQLQVVDIICTSGAPMQSAAKVPILVAFKVRVGDLDLSAERAAQQARRLRSIACAQAEGSRMLLQQDSRPMLLEPNDERKSADDAVAADLPPVDAEAGADDDDEMPPVAIHIDRETSSRSSRNQLNGGGGVGGGESSHLDPEEIDLMAANDPELSYTPSVQHLNTSVAKENAAKLAAAKSTADAAGVLVQACIFKVGDDCRQDALALQVIQWCKNIMQANGLELYLYPYRVLPNRTGSDGIIGGIIECVPNASTRDEIGKATACSLKDYYISRFGPPESASFQRAQKAFIVSAAGYAVCSWILQVKDRHNGNLMIDGEGHMIHIGFIFDISPANNLKFESAGFKLTREMVELMDSDGSTASPLVLWFQELVIRGFLAVREHRAELLAIVEPMLPSTLVCFKPNSLSGLKARMFPAVDERAAADGMRAIVYDAWDKWTTNTYDWIQKTQQGVFYFVGTSASDPEKRLRRPTNNDVEDDYEYRE